VRDAYLGHGDSKLCSTSIAARAFSGDGDDDDEDDDDEVRDSISPDSRFQ